MAATPRKSELSWLNVLFCLLVVFIHVASQAVSQADKLSWQYAAVLVCQRLSFVSVPGFFLLSGLKLTLPRKGPQSLGSYYLGRARSLLLPYLVANLGYYAVFVFYLRWMSPSLSEFEGYLLRGNLSAQFYFLIALFQFVLLTPFFRWLARRWSPLILLPFSLGLMWLSSMHFNAVLQVLWPEAAFPYADRVFTSYLFYYMAGCCIGENYPQFKELLWKNRGLIRFLALCFTVADAGLSVLSFSGRHWVPFLEYIHSMYIISAILALFEFSLRLPSPLPTIVRKIDGVSFDIYLWHCLVITLFNDKAPLLGLESIGAKFIVRFFVTYTVTIGGCLLWRELVTKFRKKETGGNNQ